MKIKIPHDLDSTNCIPEFNIDAPMPRCKPPKENGVIKKVLNVESLIPARIGDVVCVRKNCKTEEAEVFDITATMLGVRYIKGGNEEFVNKETVWVCLPSGRDRRQGEAMSDKNLQKLFLEGDEPIKVETKDRTLHVSVSMPKTDSLRGAYCDVDGCESLSDEKLTLCWGAIELPVYVCKKCFDGIKKADDR